MAVAACPVEFDCELLAAYSAGISPCSESTPPQRNIACGARDGSTTQVLDRTHHSQEVPFQRSPPIALIVTCELLLNTAGRQHHGLTGLRDAGRNDRFDADRLRSQHNMWKTASPIVSTPRALIVRAA